MTISKMNLIVLGIVLAIAILVLILTSNKDSGSKSPTSPENPGNPGNPGNPDSEILFDTETIVTTNIEAVDELIIQTTESDVADTGNITIQSAKNGSISILSGEGFDTGDIEISAGRTVGGDAGDIRITCVDGDEDRTRGGEMEIAAGNGFSNGGPGGDLYIAAGRGINQFDSQANGGSAVVESGSSVSGNGGDLIIKAGTGTIGNGKLEFRVNGINYFWPVTDGTIGQSLTVGTVDTVAKDVQLIWN